MSCHARFLHPTCFPLPATAEIDIAQERKTLRFSRFLLPTAHCCMHAEIEIIKERKSLRSTRDCSPPPPHCPLPAPLASCLPLPASSPPTASCLLLQISTS